MDATRTDTKANPSAWLALPRLPSWLACIACAASTLPALATTSAGGSIPSIEDRGMRRHTRHPSTSHRACIRPPSHNNRIFRKPGGALDYWKGDTLWKQTLQPVTDNSTRLANGTVLHDGVLHVPWETEAGAGLARVIPDGAGFRLRLDDGTAGPALRRQANGQWNLADGSDNYAPGSVLAQIVAERVTSDARTLHHAAGIIESMTLPESILSDGSAAPASQASRRHFQATVLLAVGQAFIETLSTRLKDPNASAWTPDEVRIIAPDLARHLGRPIAIYGSDRLLDIAVDIDGTPMAGDAIPDNALRLTRDDADRYGKVGGQRGQYPNVFAAVEPSTRSSGSHRALDPAHQEHLFRQELATTVDAAPMQARLERMHELWLNPFRDSPLHKQQLRGFSRLRQMLFDRNHPLDAGEERVVILLLQATLPPGQRIAIEVVRYGQPEERLAFFDTTPAATERVVIEADLDSQGRRRMYYRPGAAGNGALQSRPIADNSFSPIIDVLLNAKDGRIRQALALGEWEFQTFADRLLAKSVNGSNTRLLPATLQRLVVNDPAVLADAEHRTADSWSFNGRHYARLRDLPGRTQIIETHAPAADGSRALLGYSEKLQPWERGFYALRQHKGIWSSSWLARTGFDPLSASFRRDAATAIMANLPADVRMDTTAALRIAGSIPFSALTVFMAHPAPVEIGSLGELVLRPGLPHAKPYRTRVDISGQPVVVTPARATAPPPRPGTPLTLYRELTPAPRLRDVSSVPASSPDSSAPVSSTDIAMFNTLLASGKPIGEFITRGVGNPHIRALVTTRRLRSMVHEDEHMVLVGTAAGHVFTVAMPVNDASIQLTRSASGLASLASLPAGTRIIDDWYGVSAALADYPDHVRAIANQWASNGQQMVMPDGRASSPTAFTDEMLSAPVKFNYWNPVTDPISEAAYLDYIYDRHANPRPPQRGGLDWLQSPAARVEYARYFPGDSVWQSSISSLDALATSSLDLDAPSAGTSNASTAPRPSVIVSSESAAPPGQP